MEHAAADIEDERSSNPTPLDEEIQGTAKADLASGLAQCESPLLQKATSLMTKRMLFIPVAVDPCSVY